MDVDEMKKQISNAFERERKDYEEPKEYYSIDENGLIRCKQLAAVNNTATKKEIGNYFETEEEARRAVARGGKPYLGDFEQETLEEE